MSSFWKYNLLSFGWAGLILVLCLLPGRDIPDLTIFDYDKLVHFGIYVLLAFMMYYGWKKQTTYSALHQRSILKILILTSLYGFAVEIMQELFTADRHFDIYDALANSTGAVAGSWLSAYVPYFRK
jgi:VanZ family protein